jgi:hypothetical protein
MMGAAMREVEVTDEAVAVMEPFFVQVADMMRNRAE